MDYRFEEHISKEDLALFCRKHHISKLSLFGSTQRGELTPASDIDLLAEFEAEHIPGLFDLSRIEMELTSILGRKVDLRTRQELSSYFRDEVVRSAEVKYEEKP